MKRKKGEEERKKNKKSTLPKLILFIKNKYYIIYL